MCQASICYSQGDVLKMGRLSAENPTHPMREEQRPGEVQSQDSLVKFEH
jgi:hypothetical protein